MLVGDDGCCSNGVNSGGGGTSAEHELSILTLRTNPGITKFAGNNCCCCRVF